MLSKAYNLTCFKRHAQGADIAVVGTQTILIIEKEGVAAVRGFIESLR